MEKLEDINWKLALKGKNERGASSLQIELYNHHHFLGGWQEELITEMNYFFEKFRDIQ